MNQEATTEKSITTMPTSRPTPSGATPARRRRTASQTTPTPVKAITPPWKRVESVSTFPCPYGWLSSAGSIAFRIDRKLTVDMKMSATLSRADARTPREPETAPTPNFSRQSVTALPREKRAVRRRSLRFSGVPAVNSCNGSWFLSPGVAGPGGRMRAVGCRFRR